MPNYIPEILTDRRGQYVQSGRAWFPRPASDIKILTNHHTASHPNLTGNESVEEELKVLQELHQIHVNHDWVGLSYGIIIFPSGRAYWINDFDKVTWHDTRNFDSYAVCCVGYFHPDVNNKPTIKMLATLKVIMEWLCTQCPELPATFGDIRGHLERSSTACPGNYLFPYIVEYREKLGKVSWGKDSDMSDYKEKAEYYDKIRAIVKAEDKWSVTEPRIQELVKTEKDFEAFKKNEYQKAKDKAIEFETSYKDEVLLHKKTAQNLNELKSKYDPLKTDYDNLVLECTRLKNQNFTFPEILNIVFKFIERGYIKWKLEQPSQ